MWLLARAWITLGFQSANRPAPSGRADTRRSISDVSPALAAGAQGVDPAEWHWQRSRLCATGSTGATLHRNDTRDEPVALWGHKAQRASTKGKHKGEKHKGAQRGRHKGDTQLGCVGGTKGRRHKRGHPFFGHKGNTKGRTPRAPRGQGERNTKGTPILPGHGLARTKGTPICPGHGLVL